MVYQPAMRDLGLDPLTALHPAPSGAMLVLVQVSSMNARRQGSIRSRYLGPLRPPLGMGHAVIDPDQIEAYRKSLAESRT